MVRALALIILTVFTGTNLVSHAQISSSVQSRSLKAQEICIDSSQTDCVWAYDHEGTNARLRPQNISIAGTYFITQRLDQLLEMERSRDELIRTQLATIEASIDAKYEAKLAELEAVLLRQLAEISSDINLNAEQIDRLETMITESSDTARTEQ